MLLGDRMPLATWLLNPIWTLFREQQSVLQSFSACLN